MTVENSSARVVALDNLRVVAMLLGLVTHGVLPYTASGLAGFPVRDTHRHLLADAVYFGLHDFRMQLFFLLAGFAGTALATRRGMGELVRNRLTRIALPLVGAVLTIGPLMHLLFAWHAAERGQTWDVAHAGGWLGPNFHLWFLYYLLLVCLPLVAVLLSGRFIPVVWVKAFDAVARRIAVSWWKLPLLAVLTVPLLWDMKAWLIDTPTSWLPDLPVYVYYLGFFLAGAVLYRHRDLLPSVGRSWPVQLATGNLVVLPLMLWMTIGGKWWELELAGERPWAFVGWKAAAVVSAATYTWLNVAGLIGLFQRFFATQSGWWKYMVGASYWCYLAGFPVQAALQVWFARAGLPAVTEVVLVNALTFLVLLVSYELCVRRTWVGWVLNGKKGEPTPRPTPQPAVVFVRVGRPETLPPPLPTRRDRAAIRLDPDDPRPKTRGTGA